MSKEISDSNSKGFSFFEGRAKRREVWFFWLFMACVNILYHYVFGSSYRGVYIILFFFVFAYVPLAVKRLHDMNWSGWWAILCLVPYITIVMSFILLFCRGTYGPNKYGSDIVPLNVIYKDVLKWIGMVFVAFVLVEVANEIDKCFILEEDDVVLEEDDVVFNEKIDNSKWSVHKDDN